MKPAVAIHLLAACCMLLLQVAVPGRAGSALAWHLPSFLGPPPPSSASQLERETSGFFLDLPSSRVTYLESQPFRCVDWSAQVVEQFERTYNRTYDTNDELDKITRRGLLKSTVQRTILLNRVIENETHNLSQYNNKPSIADYYYLEPASDTQLPGPGLPNDAFLWYADITDCELGIIKYVMFELFDRLDNDDYEGAYSLLLNNLNHLPLLTAEGWEQLCNILLVRLFDRFQGDHQMDQLFRWPAYLRKLATFAYGQRQQAQPDFQRRLALVSFAYPAYFRDVKYNLQATNRTGDNVRAHEAHEAFNEALNRKLSSRNERNRRLVIFRQRWSLLNKLSGLDKSTEWRQNVSIVPEWLYQARRSSDRQTAAKPGSGRQWNSHHTKQQQQSERLVVSPNEWADSGTGSAGGGEQPRSLFDSPFSDLTDTEFVALINSDYSLVENPKEFANFVKLNFQPRPLDDAYLNELAAELEFRRQPEALAAGHHTAGQAAPERESFKLARSVVEELISQVGMPMGPHEIIKTASKELDVQHLFEQLIRHHNKTYRGEDDAQRRDERNRRLAEFTWNQAHFRAWWVQEGWNLEGALPQSHQQQQEPSHRLLSLLRLADMSWWDIKFTLFKVCCLQEQSRSLLVRTNATIEYLASNQFLCEPLVGPQQNDLLALELYYYYSVHYNKHHFDMDSFFKAFSVFRHNIDQLKRLSCPRSLTLERALRERRNIDVLNTVDTLDPKRIVTDDLNLDRFRYFTVPNLSSPPDREQAAELEPSSVEFGAPATRSNVDYTLLLAGNKSNNNELDKLRAASYYADPQVNVGNSFFARLLDTSSSHWTTQTAQLDRNKPSSKPFERLMALADLNSAAALDNKKYHLNNAGRIYDLVMQRYRYCAELVRHLNPDDVPKQRCKSVGPLNEASVNWLVENQLSEAQSRELREKDQCAYYLLGLEPWAAGLIKQDPKSPLLIEQAKC